MNAIYVLWLRQLKRYIRSKSRIVSSVAQPVLFLVALGFGFGPIYAKAGGGNYIEFLSPGIISMSILFTAMIAGIEIIWDKQFGFLKETLVAPVSRFSIMIGRTLGGVTVAMMQGAIIFIITLFVGFRPESWLSLPVAFLFMFVIAFLFTALGTAIASRMDDMQSFPLIMQLLIMPLFFLSGSLFPISQMPKTLATIAQVNPLSYGVDGIRWSLTGSVFFSPTLDLITLFLITVAIVFVGARLFSKIET
ncbi:MAG: ABC transporter permease [Patescibacteria group bacterium]|nr:ABC transporter permease [Patescibacteria group bacterium]